MGTVSKFILGTIALRNQSSPLSAIVIERHINEQQLRHEHDRLRRRSQKKVKEPARLRRL